MKRRSFLQSIIAGVIALFLPKAKAENEIDDIINETLTQDPNWIDTNKEIKWPCNYPVIVGLKCNKGDLKGEPILDICGYGDYLYVLLKGGELWRTRGGGSLGDFSKPFWTWHKVKQYLCMVDHIEVLPSSRMIIGTGIIEEKKYCFGSYCIV